MRKTLCVTGLLVSTLGAVAGLAAPRIIVIPAATGGRPTNIKFGTVTRDPHNMAALKSQNRVSGAPAAALVKDRSAAGGGFNAPGIKNGTVDTIPYFNSWFITGSRNSIYPYSMAGHSPSAGGTTGLSNQIIPLITVLLDQNGAPVYTFDPTANNQPEGSDVFLVESSPLYDASTTYPGPPADPSVQISDSVIRASFKGIRAANWHTPLLPPYSSGVVWIQFLAYNNGDWQCVSGNIPVPGAGCTAAQDFPVVNINTISNNFAFILNTEAPPNNRIPIILTDFVTAFDPTNNNSCCILGYHTAQNGILNPNGILVWTWATFLPHAGNPFGANFTDITPLSHELSELYHNPFIINVVAPWVDGSASFAQGDLEVGDVIEAMADADSVYPVHLNVSGGYTYHPQNEALLPWFTRNPMNGGLYSWPNTHTLNQCLHILSPTQTYCYGEGSAGFFFGPPY